MPHSVEEWTIRLADKSLSWLKGQRTPYIRGYNGREYDAAIDILISKRVADGECITRVRPSHIVREEEEVGEVEVVDYGGKGGKIRIVHPRE